MSKYRRQCPVSSCNSVTTDGLKFFRFPEKKESRIAWNAFTKVKDFKPCPTEVMCELHFSPENIAINKNGKKYLKKNTVPTIYYKNGQQITVQYNNVTRQYIGYGAELMLQEIEKTEHDEEKKLTELRYTKVKELKNLCRFCFSKDNPNVKCIAMSKLQIYSIDPFEIINILGISQEYDEAFNEIICMDCFDRIIDFQNYRKKCRNAQSELILDMQEIDKKILEVQKNQRYRNDTFTHWMKVEINDDLSNFEDDFNYQSQDMDMDSPDMDMDNQGMDMNSQEMDIDYSTESIFKTENEFFDVTVKSEAVVEENIVDKSQETSKKRKLNKKKNDPKVPTKMGMFKSSYECFFCRNKFVGKSIYRSHKCKVKRVKCEVDGCDSYFVNQGGYNVHLQKRHKMPKISRRLCPICKTNFQMSAAKFDEHCKKCGENTKYMKQDIQCGKCKKVFNNLQNFTAHQIFHDAQDLTKINESSTDTGKGDKKSSKDICHLCGKIFINSVGALKRHQVNVHYIEFTGNLFYCDLCPIAKPTKPLLYSHMKSTHIIRWHSCDICGKMFKNRETWRKHQLVHGDYKKNNRCQICPHQPGFVTASALKKHLARHHGGAEPVRKFICDVKGCRASYSRDDQLIRHKVKVHQIYHNNYNENIIKHLVNN